MRWYLPPSTLAGSGSTASDVPLHPLPVAEAQEGYLPNVRISSGVGAWGSAGHPDGGVWVGKASSSNRLAASATVTFARITVEPVLIHAELEFQSLGTPKSSFLARGGVYGGGASGSTITSTHNLTMVFAGGVSVGGEASAGAHIASFSMSASGGALMSGDAVVRLVSRSMMFEGSSGVIAVLSANVSTSRAASASGAVDAALTLMSSTFAQSDVELFLSEIQARVPHITAALSGGAFGLDARLPVLASSITALGGGNAFISAKLPLLASDVREESAKFLARLTLIGSAISGGSSQIKVQLPSIGSTITARRGVRGSVSAQLTGVTSLIKAAPAASLRATLPSAQARMTALSGSTATLRAVLPPLAAALGPRAGVTGSMTCRLPLIRASLRAGCGGVAHINAELPRIVSGITPFSQLAQAQALSQTQAMVMVVNTATGAVMTYENFQFNSFCEIGGTYFGSGPNGLCRVDVGDTDADAALGTVPISAGLSTGLLHLGSPNQKRISDAYLTLHTTGNLDLVVTADEGAKHPAVVAPMTAQEFGGLRQRRVPIPKGLRGTAWRFELRNLVGAAFDFSHLGLNVAASARRI